MSKKEDKNLEQEQDMAVDTTGTETEEIQEEEGAGEGQLSDLEQLQQKYDELNDQHLRTLAEYDNFRKRTQREKEELYGNATAATVEKFLPVWDNFQRASGYDTASEEFAKGFELIETGFKGVLESLKVEAFGEVGESFDPNLHYAVSHIEDESLGENVISQVMQQGFKIGDKIIRHAMVQTAN